MIAWEKSAVSRTANVWLCLLFLGCAAASPPVEYYLLTPAVDPAPAASGEGDRLLRKIALRPVSLPDVLGRPQLIVRTGETTVRVAEFHRWAGSLNREIARVLIENLNLLLHDLPAFAATDDLATDPDLTVSVQVLRFDGQPGGEVELNALWSLVQRGPKGIRLLRQTRIRIPCETPGFAGLALAHSRALAALSREIAADIRTAPLPPSPESPQTRQ